ncbi:MAG: hypothetical protein WDZ80_00785 [Candidatus Paceibacterota bacterium]
MKLTKDQKYLIYGMIALLFLAMLVFYFVNETEIVPENINDSYFNILTSSQSLVSLTNKTNEKIREVNEVESLGDIESALIEIEEARDINIQAKRSAINLSYLLEEMTREIQNVESSTLQISLLEVVMIQSRMVQEFIEYTNNVEAFLETLRNELVNPSSNNSNIIENQINLLNEKRSFINSLNQSFLVKSETLGIIENNINVE